MDVKAMLAWEDISIEKIKTMHQKIAIVKDRRKALEAKGFKFVIKKGKGRNEVCPCGSKKKFKQCCNDKTIYVKTDLEFKKALDIAEKSIEYE
jgi:hypothetical protein